MNIKVLSDRFHPNSTGILGLWKQNYSIQQQMNDWVGLHNSRLNEEQQLMSRSRLLINRLVIVSNENS